MAFAVAFFCPAGIKLHPRQGLHVYRIMEPLFSPFFLRLPKPFLSYFHRIREMPQKEERRIT